MIDKIQNIEEKSSSRKFFEVLKGLFFQILIAAIAFGIYWVIAWITLALHSAFNMPSIYFGMFFSVLIPILLILLEVKMIKSRILNGDKYVALGMILGIIIPLITTGACSFIFGASSSNNFSM